MKTRVIGYHLGEVAVLEWEDGVIDGTVAAKAALLDAAGVQRALGWPSVVDPDPTLHLDFCVTALAVMDGGGEIEGDLPYVEPVPLDVRT